MTRYYNQKSAEENYSIGIGITTWMHSGLEACEKIIKSFFLIFFHKIMPWPTPNLLPQIFVQPTDYFALFESKYGLKYYFNLSRKYARESKRFAVIVWSKLNFLRFCWIFLWISIPILRFVYTQKCRCFNSTEVMN